MLTFQVTLYIMIAFKLQTFTKKLHISNIPINNIIYLTISYLKVKSKLQLITVKTHCKI